MSIAAQLQAIRSVLRGTPEVQIRPSVLFDSRAASDIDLKTIFPIALSVAVEALGAIPKLDTDTVQRVLGFVFNGLNPAMSGNRDHKVCLTGRQGLVPGVEGGRKKKRENLDFFLHRVICVAWSPRVVRSVLANCLKLSQRMDPSDPHEAGNWGKKILNVLNKHYPSELRGAIRKFLEAVVRQATLSNIAASGILKTIAADPKVCLIERYVLVCQLIGMRTARYPNPVTYRWSISISISRGREKEEEGEKHGSPTRGSSPVPRAICRSRAISSPVGDSFSSRREKE
ncbi:hypothetical protein GW17_00014913 [Ensete ventricosum]|nr:hypothetical protein GW17_00014913 [Ensete ventricosum]